MVYFRLENLRSKVCEDLYIVEIKNKSDLIRNYNDYIKKCFSYLDSTKMYNEKEFSNK